MEIVKGMLFNSLTYIGIKLGGINKTTNPCKTPANKFEFVLFLRHNAEQNCRCYNEI